MIIKHTPTENFNSSKSETNTDELADIEAMILEKCEELRTLCYNAQRQVVIIADAKGSERGTGFSFWNLKMKGVKGQSEELITPSTEETAKAFNNLLEMINSFTMQLTKNSVGLYNSNKIKDIYTEIKKMAEDQKKLTDALTKIAEYDGESIWSDDRDDAANNMLSIAREALGRDPDGE